MLFSSLQLDGVLETKVSYKEGTANIKFDQSAIGVDEIARAIVVEILFFILLVDIKTRCQFIQKDEGARYALNH